MRRPGRRFGSIAAAWLLASSSAVADTPADGLRGVLVTRSARREGAIALRDGTLRVEGQAVPLDDLLMLGLRSPGWTLPPPNTVRLRNGEVWRCRIDSVSQEGLEIASAMLGRHRVPLRSVERIEFAPGAPPERQPPPGSLFRAKGEPLRGQLLWVDAEQLAVDTNGPLGVLTLSRESIAGYRFRPPPPPQTAAARRRDGHEVALIDGNILHGRVAVMKDGFRLKHAVFGELALRPGGVRSVVRQAEGVIYLGDLSPVEASLTPLVTARAAGKAVRVIEPGGTHAPRFGFIRGVCIAGGGTVRYRAPLSRPARFAAVVAPMGDARGAVRLRVLFGERLVVEKRLAPGGAAVEVAGEVRPGEQVTFEVQFTAPVRLPAGAVVCDGRWVEREP